MPIQNKYVVLLDLLLTVYVAQETSLWNEYKAQERQAQEMPISNYRAKQKSLYDEYIAQRNPLLIAYEAKIRH